jgi:hypothetical protein
MRLDSLMRNGTAKGKVWSLGSRSRCACPFKNSHVSLSTLMLQARPLQGSRLVVPMATRENRPAIPPKGRTRILLVSKASSDYPVPYRYIIATRSGNADTPLNRPKLEILEMVLGSEPQAHDISMAIGAFEVPICSLQCRKRRGPCKEHGNGIIQRCCCYR